MAAAQSGTGDGEIRTLLDQLQNTLRAQAQQLESQRTQLERQQSEIAALRRAIESTARAEPPASAGTVTARVDEQPVSKPQESLTQQGGNSAPAHDQAGPLKAQSAPCEDGPLSIHFGRASITPGGWVDFTSYFRSADVGSGLGTSFGSIPYNNTVAGGLSETRFSSQGSRITLRADETFGATRVFGYAEADFNGYLPSNAYVSTNSDTMRLRVYFADLARGRWEVLGGQSWSLLTPNRVGAHRS